MGEITRLNFSWTLIFSLLLLLFFGSHGAVAPATPMPACDMPLGVLLDRFATSHSHTALILSALLTLINGMMLVRIVSRNMILTDRSYLPIILYTLTAAGCLLQARSLAALVGSMLLIASFGNMLTSFRRIVQYGDLFQATLLSGILPLIYSHTVIYALMLPVALVLFRKTSREWIVAWCGYLLPFALTSYVYWGMGRPFGALGVELWHNLSGHSPAIGFPSLRPLWPLLIFGLAGATICLLAALTFRQRAATFRTRAYKSYLFFFWVMLVSVVLLALPSRSALDLPLVAVPFSIVCPLYLLHHKRRIASLIFILLPVSLILYDLLAF